MTPRPTMDHGIRPFRVLFGALTLLAVAAQLGCDSAAPCTRDDQCAQGFTCQKNKCVSVVSGKLLALDIVPPGESLAARTEFPGVTFAGDLVPLTLDATTQVLGMVEPIGQPPLYSSQAHVQVTFTSRIPGRADLQINTEMAMNQFMFGVGASRIDTAMASFLFTPGSMGTQSQPPIPIKAMLEPTLDFMFPATADMVVVRGQLVDDQNKPLAGYLARAFYPAPQGRQPISNTFPTLADGTFALLIPPGSLPTNNDNIQLTLTPPAKPDATAEQSIVDLPRFESNPFRLGTVSSDPKAPPHVYVLPAFIPATAQDPFSFVVTADDKPQSGVSVTFTMSVPVADGNAVFQSSGVSNGDGVVSLSLVPGVSAAPIAYQVMIQGRDASFGFASRCIPVFPVSLDANGNIPPPATFALMPKVHLSGTISDSKWAPVAAAQVTATQTMGLTDCGPAATPPPAASKTTGAGGDYFLQLDPGTYSIELVPPSTGTYPGVMLDMSNAVSLSSDLVKNIMLPAPQIAMGVVSGPDGAPVPMATVQIFEVFCTEAPCGATQAPISLAQTTTDMDGKFQAVLPMPLP